MIPLLIGIGAAALIGGLVIAGRREVLAETGIVPVPSDRKVMDRHNRKLEGQDKDVLQWAPKFRTAILENKEIPEKDQVFFLRMGLSTVHQESGGNPKATSYKTVDGVNNKGRTRAKDKDGNDIPLAKGMGQFIEGTWETYGVGPWNNAYKPDFMIPAIVKLLVAEAEKANGDPAKMAQAYYTGGMGDLDAKERIATASLAQAEAKGNPTLAKKYKKQLARIKDINNYIDYRLRLLDLYGDVT